MNEGPKPGDVPPDTPGEVYILPGSILTYIEYVAFARDCRKALERLEAARRRIQQIGEES